MSTELLERLRQGSLVLAGQTRETVRVAPFTAFVDLRRSMKYFSFASPDAGTGPEGAEVLAALAEAFAQHGRNGRIELTEELHPGLSGALEEAGWTLSERVPVMACTPDSLVIPPAPEDVEIIEPGADSPDDIVIGWHEALGIAFGDGYEESEIAVWRERAPITFNGAALSDGKVVGTAAASPLTVGVSEVGAVGTLPDHRRRGIAGALTARVASAAFTAGAEVVWLTSFPDAVGIYAQAGFSTIGWASNYDAP